MEFQYVDLPSPTHTLAAMIPCNFPLAEAVVGWILRILGDQRTNSINARETAHHAGDT